MHSTSALTQMGFGHLLQNADLIALIVLALLLLMSVASWYYIITKSIRAYGVKAEADRVVQAFWDAPSLREGVALLEKESPTEPFSKIALDAANAAIQHDRHSGGRLGASMSRGEFVVRALTQSVNRENARLEVGLTVLATTGNTAPFVGLFGTVWGIYHALIKIGMTGEASLDAVAGPVGEALIMTAIGLAVAVPAVLGYNFLVRNNRVIAGKFDSFAHDLEQFFEIGAGAAAEETEKR
ncbi:MotA/TolQ/ExbB proton channel family protein [Stenotrophobium rhamnosiphilum]|uniref:Biopolymer transport protein ExbB n=1 Tax=Stenotrophobium rhamnosiphilum TaxID=2029166 RepID=A0A2T5MJC8_9GAMM|nr:MotA/TolQ/ExbB proton channel family protein [Stenotrophobium rhamnosiphilum]PTU32686.1 biopolymer transporter ExbB [Stenotrophobium rhamnosiphilum]